jgi:acetyl-CoA carboxylase biotin carboxyl carrier protein
MDLNEIQNLIKFVAKSGASEVELETSDFKIIIKTPSSHKKNDLGEVPVYQAPVAGIPGIPVPIAAPALAPQVAAPVAAAPAEPAKPAAEDSKYVTIKSPMIGTFYRAPSPDKPAFVNVGDDIKVGSKICIIEAMKLFNEIESEISGKIVKVLVDDTTPVEYDQPLYLVDPA